METKRTIEQREVLQKFCRFLLDEVLCDKFTEKEVIQIYKELGKKIQGDLYTLEKKRLKTT